MGLRTRLHKFNLWYALYLRYGKLSATFTMLSLLGLLVAGVMGGFYVLNSAPADPLPQDVKQQAKQEGFNLYYPTKLPSSDFYFDQAAYDQADKVVTYKYAAPGGKALYVSIQPKPKDLNYEEFRTKQLTGARQIDTPLGTADIGLLHEVTVSSIITDKEWIMISSGQGVDIGNLEQASRSLVASH